MNWRTATALVLIVGLMVWVIWDVIAYIRGGNSATISRLLLDTAIWQPGFSLALVFCMGVLVGHLFLPQHVVDPTTP
jgi:hypothetical protein